MLFAVKYALVLQSFITVGLNFFIKIRFLNIFGFVTGTDPESFGGGV